MRADLRLVLAGARVATGAVGLLAPQTLHRLSLLDPGTSAAASAYTRFFSTRAIAMGASYLAGDQATRSRLRQMGLLVDSADTVALASMTVRRRIPLAAGLFLMAATASAAAVGALSRPGRDALPASRQGAGART